MVKPGYSGIILNCGNTSNIDLDEARSYYKEISEVTCSLIKDSLVK